MQAVRVYPRHAVLHRRPGETRVGGKRRFAFACHPVCLFSLSIVSPRLTKDKSRRRLTTVVTDPNDLTPLSSSPTLPPPTNANAAPRPAWVLFLAAVVLPPRVLPGPVHVAPQGAVRAGQGSHEKGAVLIKREAPGISNAGAEDSQTKTRATSFGRMFCIFCTFFLTLSNEL